MDWLLEIIFCSTNPKLKILCFRMLVILCTWRLDANIRESNSFDFVADFREKFLFGRLNEWIYFTCVFTGLATARIFTFGLIKVTAFRLFRENLQWIMFEVSIFLLSKCPKLEFILTILLHYIKVYNDLLLFSQS